MAFGSYNTGIATVSPANDTTSIYQISFGAGLREASPSKRISTHQKLQLSNYPLLPPTHPSARAWTPTGGAVRCGVRPPRGARH
jgi:hypothetical protein